MPGFEKQKPEKQSDILEVCSVCRKPVTPTQRKSSFTSYLFKENRCRCDAPTSSSARKTQPEDANAGVPRRQQTVVTEPDFEDSYQILALVGEGGMGTVWKVQDKGIGRFLAIKILRQELASDNSAVQRFKQEAELATTLTHPNLVAVYCHGITRAGAPYLVMDYLEGESLADILKRELQLDVQRVLDITTQIGQGVAHAHAKGIIHRDLKPSNIILITNERGIEEVRIVDFGIAKVMPSINEQTSNLTQTGELFGSPQYMSPEQCLGDTVDERTDIYSLGCVLFELLCGTAPFSNSNPIKVIMGHINDTPDLGQLRRANVPEPLIDVVSACLLKSPEARYGSMQELIDDLAMVRSGKAPFNCQKLHAKERRTTSNKKKSKLLFSIFCAGATVLSLLLIGFACWFMYLKTNYVHSDLPQVETHAREGTWRKASEDAQQLINEGKFPIAKAKLKEAENLARESNKLDEVVLTLKKEAMLAQIMSDPALVRKLTLEINLQEGRIEAERSNSELTLFIETFDAYPDKLSAKQKEKFDSLSRRLLDWSRKLIKEQRFRDARDVLKRLIAKLNATQSNPQVLLHSRLALVELAVSEYRFKAFNAQPVEWHELSAARKDLAGITVGPENPLLSKDDWFRALTLRAYLEELYSGNAVKSKNVRLQRFESLSKTVLDYYNQEGANSPHAAEGFMLIADSLDSLYRLKEAQALYDKAINLFQASGDVRNVNYCYSKVAVNLITQRKPEEARDFLTARLREASQKQSDDLLVANLYSCLGNILWRQDQIASATDAYLNELKIKQQLLPPSAWVNTNLLGKITNAYDKKATVDKSSYEKCEPYYLQWRAILELQLPTLTAKPEILKTQTEIADVKDRLAFIYMMTNRDDQARRLLKERFDFVVSVPATDVVFVSERFPELAQKYLTPTEMKRLSVRIEVSTEVAKKQLTGIALSELLCHYGKMMWFLGKKTEAVSILKESADIAETNFKSDPFIAGNAISIYAMVLSSQGKTQESKELRERLNDLMAGE